MFYSKRLFYNCNINLSKQKTMPYELGKPQCQHQLKLLEQGKIFAQLFPSYSKILMTIRNKEQTD